MLDGANKRVRWAGLLPQAFPRGRVCKHNPKIMIKFIFSSKACPDLTGHRKSHFHEVVGMWVMESAVTKAKSKRQEVVAEFCEHVGI